MTTYRALLLLLLLAHGWAVCRLFPPGSLFGPEPLFAADHPVHAHRVYFFRQALRSSGLPWGYDPSLSAGTVRDPAHDVGAKPQQLLGVALPFLSETAVVRLFLFAAALTLPLGTLWAARRLALPVEAQCWVVVALLGPAWCYQNFPGFFRWGMAAFAAASYFAPLVLVLFLGFLERPTRARYAVTLAALILLWMLHILGPVLIAPVLLLLALTARPLTRGWRLAALLLLPAAFLANAFWLAPALLALHMPQPPCPAFQPYHTPDLVYGSAADLLGRITPLRLMIGLGALALAGYGFVLMKRHAGGRVAAAFAAAALLGLLLKCFGSFLPVVVRMQPARFLLGAFVFVTIPVGLALHALAGKARLPQAASVGAAAVAVLLTAWLAEKVFLTRGPLRINYAGREERGLTGVLALPKGVPPVSSIAPLTAFVQERTGPEDRLLVQTRVQCEPVILPRLWGREVIGSSYPDGRDPANFLSNSLWGRKLECWSAGELREALGRWGVSWVFTCTPEAGRLMAGAAGAPGEEVGAYQAFRMPSRPTRFLIGQGRLEADVNRLGLSGLRPDKGLVVLRYRYHPAWEAEGVTVRPYPVAEDPKGFIALIDPPEEVILRFNGLALLRASWPKPAKVSGRGECQRGSAAVR